ncbi:hypothetical protein ACWEOP_40275 [Streptomyces chartreusis]
MHEADESNLLSTSTVSDVLRRKSFPRMETARWLGLGIGGPELGESFVSAWKAARRNHACETHEEAASAASRAQEGRHTPLSWWRYLSAGTRFAYIQVLVSAVLAVVAIVGVYWIRVM